MYCTQQDMIDRFGEEELISLTNRENLDVIDTTVLNQAIADASAEIDGYLATRYRLPLSETHPALPRLASDIARYLLYDDAAPAKVEDRFEKAVAYLRDVAKGNITLVQQTGSTAETAGVAEFETGRNVFKGGGF